MDTSMTLYEIAVADGASASPFVWRVKFALSRKGLAYRSRMLGLTDIPDQFGGRFATVPILDVGSEQINESLVIADWLDRIYPDRPPIFAGTAERAMIGFFDQWLRDLIVTGILPIYALDAHDRAAPRDRDYYRRSREPFFGHTLEEVVANRKERLVDVRRAFDPVRRALAVRPFLGGEEPNFADMCLLGLFIFVGTIGSLPLLAAADPLVAYAERGLAAFAAETASLRLRLSEEAG